MMCARYLAATARAHGYRARATERRQAADVHRRLGFAVAVLPGRCGCGTSVVLYREPSGRMFWARADTGRPCDCDHGAGA